MPSEEANSTVSAENSTVQTKMRTKGSEIPGEDARVVVPADADLETRLQRSPRPSVSKKPLTRLAHAAACRS